MKKVRVNINQIGLVLKNDEFVEILSTGVYWFFKNEQVYIYEKGSQFNSPVDLNQLMQNQEVMDALEIVEVGDNEIVLQFEDKVFKCVLTAGKFAYWRGLRNYRFDKYD
ncbi:slipin family protein, partial [Lacihabitans soyangensis]|nr:slipin family protein [Lacihabitans soyangensis]